MDGPDSTNSNARTKDGSSNDDAIQQLIQHFVSGFTRSIPSSHLMVGCTNLIHVTQKDIRALLVHKRLPNNGWSDHDIQYLLNTIATLDTNTKVPIQQQSQSSKPRWVGVGEREGRVYSSLVLNRHYGYSHGIGRSGNLQDPQPKAVGSTLITQLTNALALDVIRRGGSQIASSTSYSSLLLPLCTGMSISLVLQSLRRPHRRSVPTKDIVLWSRIDQKSCYKAVLAAGLQCIVIPTKLKNPWPSSSKNYPPSSSDALHEHLEDDSVTTNLEALQSAIEAHGPQRILAIITTTSCFAPRVPDRVDQVANLIKEYNSKTDNVDHVMHHVINHAYGLQCPKTGKLIHRACTIGQVDAIVCSLDKNFLVPVGGAIVLSPKPHIINAVGAIYAGRATSTHIVDLIVTLLSMGLSGYSHLYQQRLHLVPKFIAQFQDIASKYNERILICPTNTISYAMTLDGLVRPRRIQGTSVPDSGYTPSEDLEPEETEIQYLQSIERDLTQLGAMLFHRCISGTRVVARNVTQLLEEDVLFHGFGSSHHDYPHAYLTAACVIGIGEAEMDEFFLRLDKVLAEFRKKQRKS